MTCDINYDKSLMNISSCVLKEYHLRFSFQRIYVISFIVHSRALLIVNKKKFDYSSVKMYVYALPPFSG